ncbi:hypothetical protein [Xenorhabdus miraniensis]|uniref:Inverse autotransporter beta-barrel domain-containing protein n=1 Tax=Xenorhabdus miraniensis TaxID=351674 RepID=A0A2D0JSX8_9GAMM|nr:hypothetical protein [Xenorhabdus miraniensis]PHM49436.1 hypothetical protein Xmir_01358 [Xenorhabdus miraniensis]
MANPKNKMTITNINDLIIGQTVNLTVTLTSDQKITPNSKVTIKRGYSSNIIFKSNSADLTNKSGDHEATATLSFTIKPDTTDDSKITFELDTTAQAGGQPFLANPQPFTGNAKKAPSKKTMGISISSKADLVIGQHVDFIVTLKSDTPILPAKKVTVTGYSPNIQFDTDLVTLTSENGALTATAQLGFTVLQKVGGNPVLDGSEITFELETDATTTDGGNFKFPGFQGTANEIDMKSLALFVENSFLKTVISGDKKPSEENNSTAISTTLKSKSGKSLAHTPVFITSTALHKMKDFNFKKSDKITDITLEKQGHNEGLMIASDESGLVKFYLYPKLSEIVILTLRTVILDDVADIPAKQVVYAVNYKNPGYMDSIGQAMIDGFTIGNLSADQGMREFYTIVSSYDNATVDDMILFFVNGKYINHSVRLHNLSEQLDKPSISLPYSIFEKNTPSQFSYSVIKANGHALYSEPLTLNYIGGVSYEPNPDFKRKYNPCIVHTSLGVGPDNILQPGGGNYINYDAIMQYPGYKHNGLFIEITRSKTNNSLAETNPVPLNITDITLNMYINSDSNGFQKTYTQQINLTYIGGSGGNPDSLFFQIPYKEIVGIQGNDYIYFDYQFYIDENLEYGEKWYSDIDTTPDPGNKDTDNH